MLYLDYGRKHGEWIPNRHGGRENLDAIEFLRFLNEGVYRDFPDVQTIAEESTAWPQVSRPTYVGGLGFGMKWNMGWMHDTLGYFKRNPVYRKHHHDELTFSLWYAFHENFVLPLSHDEVVHGKSSIIGRMPGDAWQQFANLRLLYGYMWTHPGKKLLFMGDEFGQRREWTHEDSLEWHVLDARPPPRRRAALGVGPQPALPRQKSRCTRRTFRSTDSAGCSAATGSRALSPSFAFRQTTRRCSSCSTSRPCRATTTASACRRAAAGARS